MGASGSGKSLSSLVKTATGALKTGSQLLGAVGGAAEGIATKRRRSRGLFMRRGKVFVGFTAKEVKLALRRRPGAGQAIHVVERGARR